MGKGDIKTRRGKIIAGSYGVRRKKNNKRNKKASPQAPVIAAAEVEHVNETAIKVESTLEETPESVSPPEKKEAVKKPAKKTTPPKAKTDK